MQRQLAKQRINCNFLWFLKHDYDYAPTFKSLIDEVQEDSLFPPPKTEDKLEQKKRKKDFKSQLPNVHMQV